MDVLITPPLSRAARGLLDWQQSELAAQAALSLTAVKNFESGKRTHARTTAAIQSAFENSGIEFPMSGGVRLIDDILTVQRFSGNNFIGKWNEDLYAAIRAPHQEIFISSLDETLWPKESSALFLEWYKKMKVTSKSIVPEGNFVMQLPKKSYRILPPDMLGKISYQIYADRIAFVLWKKKQVVVLRNSHVVQTFKNQFLHLWRMGREA